MRVVLYLLSAVIISVNSARILAVFPTPSISHQVVFRPLIHELAKRGHEVVLVTTDPVFKNGGGPPNLTEIDLHDVSYKPWEEYVPKDIEVDGDLWTPTVDYDKLGVAKMLAYIFKNIMEVHLLSEPVQKLINDKTQKFDLVILEAYQRPALVYSHIFKAPVIEISSFGTVPFNLETVGAMMHPILYPNIFSRKISNLTLLERVQEYYNFAIRLYVDHFIIEDDENKMLRQIVGPDVPSVSELANNVDMIFLNVHPMWEFNRPVPPNVIYLGALHIKPEKELPKDLKSYLDSSKNGVIYMSFGTNVNPALFPPGSIEKFVKVFAELPYNILWKWHTEDVPGLSKNVKISKWLPQRDLLMHPNIKLFITQGGLQSTDETILAGVPVVGIPMNADQWYNVDRYVDFKIGERIHIMTMKADTFRDAINTVINDRSYRDNILKLREVMYDQPQSPLSRAVWWTEHVLRHGGAGHLKTRAANMSWTQYYEIPLVATFVVGVLSVVVVLGLVVGKVVRMIIKSDVKVKQS